ncbi:MAG: SUMF1/EgtB/PvdO family nonheme iron enzyme [Bacteroidia bacterium]|nr:formylglycine-generating enzyme family protein [Bacteroidia bacterium]MDW8332892.1 SUMF1/EgtB/PvdO family nonheme iron enzyme [Bacteroidia bacterium]
MVALTLLIHSWIWANHARFHAIEKTDDGRVVFRISWDHSWNLPPDAPPANHDAVWVFAKSFFPRRHLTIEDVRSDDLDVVLTSDRTGVFLKRKDYGSGSVNNAACTLKVSIPEEAEFVRLYAVEMVYVPQGSFYLGDGASKFTLGAGNGEPLLLASEARLDTGATADRLAVGASHLPDRPLPDAYPKGYGGFYVMKYEVSQRQYADFLNSLTREEQLLRMNVEVPKGAGVLISGHPRRNAIVMVECRAEACTVATDGDDDGVFDEFEDGATRACSGIAWADAAAFLDWAALSPMTELEFEKLCRGPFYPLPKEYPWGTIYSRNAVTVVEDGTPKERAVERPGPGEGLANHGGRFDEPFVWGPMRCGFAADDSTDRVAAGAGYFGAFDLGGNVWEPCVSVRAADFDGAHGDGELSGGQADVPSWPGADKVILRGGGWNSLVVNDLDYEFRDLAVSDRFYYNLVHNVRRNTTGVRGVRRP